MVIVRLIDNTPKAPFWRIAIGPGGMTYLSGIVESDKPIKLPTAGQIDWFSVELLGADRRTIGDRYLQNITVKDNYCYDYSFRRNQLIERVPILVSASYLWILGLASAAAAIALVRRA